MKKLNNIDFLIFDLGNVIIDIDIPLTIKELKNELSEEEFHLAENFFASEIHAHFETGLVDEMAFRNQVRKDFKKEWSDEKIDTIWNALLLQIPQERIDLLKELKNHYTICMLSNTNSIHYKKVEEILMRDCGVNTFSPIFDRLFLSYEMGYKKPDPAIYEEMVRQLNTTAERCMFFDDLEANLTAADNAGLQTYHIDHPKALVEFFSNVQ
jgi:glucose-1-phosphatase